MTTERGPAAVVLRADRLPAARRVPVARQVELTAAPGRVFPLADAAAAFDALEHQHIRGKVVPCARPERRWRFSEAARN